MRYVRKFTACLMMTLLSAGFYAAASDTQAAAAKRPSSTAASATRVRPSPSRSQYRSAVSPRRAAANRTARDTRRSSGRSATARPRAIALPGSPVTSWSGWNRATQPRTTAPERRQRRSPSGMQVRFRAERASVELTRIQRNPQTGEIIGGGGPRN
ncbi:MAG: hypothetical protein U5Q16_04770 [Gammaproteobacteria bacterium]|nr:hypothetical protein [Gammaproteobacteria bacterium]